MYRLKIAFIAAFSPKPKLDFLHETEWSPKTSTGSPLSGHGMDGGQEKDTQVPLEEGSVPGARYAQIAAGDRADIQSPAFLAR